MQVAAKAKYTIIAIDPNVTTLILDGKAFRNKSWNAVATLPALAIAVAVMPRQHFDKILKVRRPELHLDSSSGSRSSFK